LSRGLGWLQREILATLEEAKQAPWGKSGFPEYVGWRGMERMSLTHLALDAS
jgi:hypothetical protein